MNTIVDMLPFSVLALSFNKGALPKLSLNNPRTYELGNGYRICEACRMLHSIIANLVYMSQKPMA